jgi:hypothetical protein
MHSPRQKGPIALGTRRISLFLQHDYSEAIRHVTGLAYPSLPRNAEGGLHGCIPFRSLRRTRLDTWLTGIFFGSRVLRTDVGCELLVAPLLIVLLHFLEGVPNRRP